jgi:hypothetical protein
LVSKCGILGLTVYDRVDIYRISTGRVFDRILPSRRALDVVERCLSLNTTYSELSVCPSPTFFVTPVLLLSEAKEDHSTSTFRVGGVMKPVRNGGLGIIGGGSSVKDAPNAPEPPSVRELCVCVCASGVRRPRTCPRARTASGRGIEPCPATRPRCVDYVLRQGSRSQCRGSGLRPFFAAQLRWL